MRMRDILRESVFSCSVLSVRSRVRGVFEVAEVDREADVFAAVDRARSVAEDGGLRSTGDGYVFEDGEDRRPEPDACRGAVGKNGSGCLNIAGVLSGEFGKSPVVPLVVPAAQFCGAISVASAPRKCVGTPIVRCFREPRVAGAGPEILASRSKACCQRSCNARCSMQGAEHAGVLLRTGSDDAE